MVALKQHRQRIEENVVSYTTGDQIPREIVRVAAINVVLCAKLMQMYLTAKIEDQECHLHAEKWSRKGKRDGQQQRNINNPPTNISKIRPKRLLETRYTFLVTVIQLLKRPVKISYSKNGTLKSNAILTIPITHLILFAIFKFVFKISQILLQFRQLELFFKL